MVEKQIISTGNVVELLGYRRARLPNENINAVRVCRHCRALLADGESEDDCSSAVFAAEQTLPSSPTRKRAVSDTV